MEEWRDTVVGGVWSHGWPQLGLEAPKRRVISLCPKWVFFFEIRRKTRDPLVKSRRRRRKEGAAVIRVEAAETQRLCVNTSADELHGANNGSGGRERHVEELSFVPSVVSESRWALHTCDRQVWSKKASSSTNLWPPRREEGAAAHTD